VKLEALVESGLDWVRPTLLWRIWERMLENEFVERSIALAAKAFISLLPMLLIFAAISPTRVREAMTRTLVTHFGIDGASLVLVRGAFQSPTKVWNGTGFAGLILILFFATSFTNTMARMYMRAWRLAPRRGGKRKLWGLAWLAVFAAYGGLLGALRVHLTGPVGTPLFYVLSLVGSVFLWWATAWAMLGRRIRWRPLLPTAVLTGAGLSAYAVTSSIWMPRVLASHVAQFGFFGLSLALVTWFVGAAFVLVVSACVAPVLAEDDGLLGRLTLGDDLSPLAQARL
jgi:membrane protein